MKKYILDVTECVACPYCNASDQMLEDLGDHPSYLSAYCTECNRNFNYNTDTNIITNDHGHKIN